MCNGSIVPITSRRRNLLKELWGAVIKLIDIKYHEENKRLDRALDSKMNYAY